MTTSKLVMGSRTKIFIVLEYITGGELFDKIVIHGRMGEDEARGYFHQLINVVDFCHSRGVYHRDFKLENLLLDTYGNLKISDFGLSVLSHQVRTTYENFRYRYDKKDNPYTKGPLRNFMDVFFTKIPPSMNDFRSWALEETIEAGFFTPNIGTDITSAKEKVDIDVRSKLELDGGTSIPSLLQNLDYTAVDCDELDEKTRVEDDAMNPFAEPISQEQNQANFNYFGDRPADEEDGVLVVAGVNEGNSLNRTSPSFAHNVNAFGHENSPFDTCLLFELQVDFASLKPTKKETKDLIWSSEAILDEGST